MEFIVAIFDLMLLYLFNIMDVFLQYYRLLWYLKPENRYLPEMSYHQFTWMVECQAMQHMMKKPKSKHLPYQVLTIMLSFPYYNQQDCAVLEHRLLKHQVTSTSLCQIIPIACKTGICDFPARRLPEKKIEFGNLLVSLCLLCPST